MLNAEPEVVRSGVVGVVGAAGALLASSTGGEQPLLEYGIAAAALVLMWMMHKSGADAANRREEKLMEAVLKAAESQDETVKEVGRLRESLAVLAARMDGLQRDSERGRHREVRHESDGA